MTQISDIENALMRFAVRADNSGPVQSKRYRTVIQADILHDLVIGAL